MHTRKSLIALAACLALLVALAPAEAGKSAFPRAGQYVIKSKPTFLITVGENQEVVECQATLTIRAGNPYITAKGTRRVDLEVIDWKASGKSELLGGPLNFRMKKGMKVDDKSFVETVGLAKVADFPAQAQFAVPYELSTPFGSVSNLVGVTRGSIKAFPPSDDVFVMEKGDIAKVMAELMPTPLSAMSASGEVTPLDVTIRPLACACPASDLDGPVDDGGAGTTQTGTGGN